MKVTVTVNCPCDTANKVTMRPPGFMRDEFTTFTCWACESKLAVLLARPKKAEDRKDGSYLMSSGLREISPTLQGLLDETALEKITQAQEEAHNEPA